MGYLTDYFLDIESSKKEKIIQEMREYSEEIAYAIESDGSSYHSTKWYDHKEYLEHFSNKYSNTLFILKGYGEERDDIWIEYYYNGKMQYCKAIINFESFNIEKLK